MAVIAMTQEMATMGKDVALGVCEALGLQQVRHEVGDHVAGMMHVKKSLIRRIREGKAGRIEKWAADEKTISIFTAEEVLDLAVKGNVLIRGCGATQILRLRKSTATSRGSSCWPQRPARRWCSSGASFAAATPTSRFRRSR